MRVVAVVGALFSACVCREQASVAAAEWVPTPVECSNLVADLGRYGDPRYEVRYFGPPTLDAGLAQAPDVPKRLMYSAIVHECNDANESERWLKAAICMVPPNCELVAEAMRQLRLIEMDRDGGSLGSQRQRGQPALR